MRILLFVEDAGQSAFVSGLVTRVCEEVGASCDLETRNAVGGKGSALRTLRQYVRDMEGGRESFAEILVVGIDANCSGPAEVVRSIRLIAQQQGFAGTVVCAVPDPHVEVWYLADGRAVLRAIGEAGNQPPLPAYKCEPDYYKQLLRNAFLAGDIDPPAGGAEYGDDIARKLDFQAASASQPSLNSFLDELRGAIRVASLSNTSP